MSESKLKKEFTSRDLQRIRNLISKNGTIATGSQVGYTKNKERHSEGDVWEELGKTWTIKNGIKMNITKLNKARNTGLIPMFCPCCSRSLKNDMDKKMFRLREKCLDCQLEFETQLKYEGKFEEYEKQTMVQNAEQFVKHNRNNLDDYINEMKSDTMVSESGEIDDWHGNEAYLETIKQQMVNELKQIEEIWLQK